jgi:hypothetical protein
LNDPAFAGNDILKRVVELQGDELGQNLTKAA